MAICFKMLHPIGPTSGDANMTGMYQPGIEPGPGCSKLKTLLVKDSLKF